MVALVPPHGTWRRRGGRHLRAELFRVAGDNRSALATREEIGVYYLLRNEPDKALVVFNQTYEQSHDPYDAMHAALIADTIGNTDERLVRRF